MVMYQIVKGGFNTKWYIGFVKAILKYFDENNIMDPIIVMDNVGFHKTGVVKRILPQCTTLVGPNALTGPSALLLPPYSPFPNPIKEVFRLLKYMVAKQKKNTVNLFTECIKQKVKLIGNENATAYFNHMVEFLHKAQAQEHIK